MASPNITYVPNPVGADAIGGDTVVISAEFTRPNDTIQYAANADVVGTNPATILVFPGAAKKMGSGGTLTRWRIIKSTTLSTGGNFQLFLMNAPPSSVVTLVDNIPFPVIFGDRTRYVGITTSAGMVVEGAGSDSAILVNNTDKIPYVCAPNDTALYGVLLATGAYIPAALEQFFVEIVVERD